MLLSACIVCAMLALPMFQVAEYDSPANLLEKTDGIFASLVEVHPHALSSHTHSITKWLQPSCFVVAVSVPMPESLSLPLPLLLLLSLPLCTVLGMVDVVCVWSEWR